MKIAISAAIATAISAKPQAAVDSGRHQSAGAAPTDACRGRTSFHQSGNREIPTRRKIL
jgi:hypothetical protein